MDKTHSKLPCVEQFGDRALTLSPSLKNLWSLELTSMKEMEELISLPLSCGR